MHNRILRQEAGGEGNPRNRVMSYIDDLEGSNSNQLTVNNLAFHKKMKAIKKF